jgi:hypothetical protein
MARMTCIRIVPLACLAWLAAAAYAQPVLKNNPYARIDWAHAHQHKANLHTHTTESDGRLTPAQTIDHYHQRGYDILAITDHNKWTHPWTDHGRDAVELGMVDVPGNELSRHHHTIGLFKPFEYTTNDWDTALQQIGEADGLGFICHPAMHWRKHWSANVGKRHAPGLRVPMDPLVRRITTGDFTVEAWFRTKQKGRAILLGNYQSKRGCSLNLELHTRNRVRIFVSPEDHKKTVDLNVKADDLSIEARDGRWHHLLAAREGKQVRLYLDGKLAGQAEDTAGRYELRGDVYYIGRDTRIRSEDTWFAGDLGPVRLWGRALGQDEVAALAAGHTPGTKQGPGREGMIAEYRMDQSHGKPLSGLALTDGQIDDTAGHPQGPFHATWAIHGNPTTVTTEAATGRTPRHALRYAPVDLAAIERAEGVPDDVADYYTKRFRDNPHLIGIEFLNGTRSLGEHVLDRQLWDMILMRTMPDRPVWGFAVDDMHRIEHLGKDWVSIITDHKDLKHTRKALEAGAFFIVSTRVHAGEAGSVELAPRIQRVEHDPAAGTITLVATEADKPFPAEACQWVADGKVIHTGLTLNYRATPGIRHYVRAELRGRGALVCTNPFSFDHPTPAAATKE